MTENTKTTRLDATDSHTIRIDELKGSGPKLDVTQLIDNRYSIKKRLQDKVGGEADVFLGTDENNGEEIVIKIYHHGIKPKVAILEKILALSIEGIIGLYNFGEVDGRFYEIQQFAAGGTLNAILPISEKQLRQALPILSNALKLLHEAGIVHRDIKPENIMFLDREKKKIVFGDFGISTLFDETDLSVRKTKAARTLGYAAPEAYSTFAARESDFYSLGITILEATTGVNPFAGLTEEQVMLKTMTGRIEIPKSLSIETQKLIAGLLLKERELRFGHDEIQRYLNNVTLSLPAQNLSNQTDIRQRPIQNFYFDKERKQRVENLNQLVDFMRADFEQSVKHLRRGQISTVLRNSSSTTPELLELATEIDDLGEQESDNEVFYFKAIYCLQGQIGYPGKWTTPEELGRYILANQDIFKKVLWD